MSHTNDQDDHNSDPGPDPDALVDTIDEQLMDRVAGDYLRPISRQAVFCSPGDYDALHRIDDDSLVTTYADKLSDVELLDDQAVPDGDPRVLPESIEDFRRDARLQDILTNRHAREIVERFVTIDTDRNDKPGPQRVQASVDVLFEVLSEQVELDQETIDEHNLRVTVSVFERSFDQGECVRPISFTAQRELARTPDELTDSILEPFDSPMITEAYTQLHRKLAASIGEKIGGSASLPITGEKEVAVEPDYPPAAFTEERYDDWGDPVEYQTETETVRCGERILDLGRIYIPDPSDQ